MHKRTHLTVTESRIQVPKKRHNRKRRNWNRILQRFAVILALAEIAVLLFANPYLRVTKVRVDGCQTLTPAQVFQEAHVPNRTNIFWLYLRQPFVRRLAADPVVDHATRAIQLPDTLVLTIAERQPTAVLAAGGQFWLLDPQGIPYRVLQKPLPHVPLVQVADRALPVDISLGHSLNALWVSDAYQLLALVSKRPDLAATKITVDQNSNLCLNRKDNLQIKLGQPDSLPQKVALADAAVSAYGGALARRAVYIDVSCPQQAVWMPRKSGRNKEEFDGSDSRIVTE